MALEPCLIHAIERQEMPLCAIRIESHNACLTQFDGDVVRFLHSPKEKAISLSFIKIEEKQAEICKVQTVHPSTNFGNALISDLILKTEISREEYDTIAGGNGRRASRA